MAFSQTGITPLNVWQWGGNTITTPSLASFGTKNNTALFFKVNNVRSGVIDSLGNSFFGYKSGKLDALTTLSNTAFGYKANTVNTAGLVNCAFGAQSLLNNTGTSNSAFGYNSGRDNTAGGNNTYFGESAGRSNTSLSDNTGIGKAAILTATSQGNIALGCHAGRYATSKGYEFFVGSVNRNTYASDTTYSLLYGVMNANNNNTDQRLSVNGGLIVYRTTTLTGIQNNGNMITTGTGSVGGGVTTSTIYGSSVSGGTLNIFSTSNSTKGLIQIGSTGSVNIGNGAVNPTSTGILRIGQGTSFFDVGELSTANGGTGAAWLNQGNPSSTNFLFSRDNTNGTTSFNSPTGCELRLSVGNAASLRVFNTRIYNNVATTIGASTVPNATLTVIGDASVSATSSLNGLQLVSGGYSVTTKVIDATAGDAVTINSPIGQFRKDATGTTFVLTNSQITANSVIMLTPANAAIDATAIGWTVSKGAGSATITFNLAPTANFDMMFMIMN